MYVNVNERDSSFDFSSLYFMFRFVFFCFDYHLLCSLSRQSKYIYRNSTLRCAKSERKTRTISSICVFFFSSTKFPCALASNAHIRFDFWLQLLLAGFRFHFLLFTLAFFYWWINEIMFFVWSILCVFVELRISM